MKTCVYDGTPLAEPRSHPWSGAAGDADSRYYDLTLSPALIRTSLEDFVPWARYPAVDAFYALLERLNHLRSPLESNDCAFSGPAENAEPTVHKQLECSGRLMVLFRALARNTVPSEIEELRARLHRDLSADDPAFRWGVIGTSVIPVRFLALAGEPGPELGAQLMISFWAWGDSEPDTMQNLGRLFKALGRALRSAAA